MTSIKAPIGIHGHLPDRRLTWIEFDPSELVEAARVQVPELPNLPADLARCTRGAWECTAYVRFVPPGEGENVAQSVIVQVDQEEFVIDVDDHGSPIGIELLHVALSDEHAEE